MAARLPKTSSGRMVMAGHGGPGHFMARYGNACRSGHRCRSGASLANSSFVTAIGHPQAAGLAALSGDGRWSPRAAGDKRS